VQKLPCPHPPHLTFCEVQAGGATGGAGQDMPLTSFSLNFHSQDNNSKDMESRENRSRNSGKSSSISRSLSINAKVGKSNTQQEKCKQSAVPSCCTFTSILFAPGVIATLFFFLSCRRSLLE